MNVSTDLHAHTLYSDARSSPGALMAVRKAQGLEVVAITDHDVFAGVRGGAYAAQDLGLVVIPAAELTSVLHFGTSQAEQIHILCYFPPTYLKGDRLEQTWLYQRGLRVQARWREFILEWLADQPQTHRERFSRHSDLRYTSAEEFPGLQTLIDRAVEASPELYASLRQHHTAFWHTDRALFGWTPEELIEAIRADGGIDVVAHPIRYRDHDRLDRLLQIATGVEVYTSRHNAAATARFRAFAEQNQKLWTASTDDHQAQPYAAPAAGMPRQSVERLLGTGLERRCTGSTTTRAERR